MSKIKKMPMEPVVKHSTLTFGSISKPLKKQNMI